MTRHLARLVLVVCSDECARLLSLPNSIPPSFYPSLSPAYASLPRIVASAANFSFSRLQVVQPPSLLPSRHSSRHSFAPPPSLLFLPLFSLSRCYVHSTSHLTIFLPSAYHTLSPHYPHLLPSTCYLTPSPSCYLVLTLSDFSRLRSCHSPSRGVPAASRGSSSAQIVNIHFISYPSHCPVTRVKECYSFTHWPFTQSTIPVSNIHLKACASGPVPPLFPPYLISSVSRSCCARRLRTPRRKREPHRPRSGSDSDRLCASRIRGAW